MSAGARARIQAARRKTIHECIEHWGAETPFDSLSGYMMERAVLPVRLTFRIITESFVLQLIIFNPHYSIQEVLVKQGNSNALLVH